MLEMHIAYLESAEMPFGPHHPAFLSFHYIFLVLDICDLGTLLRVQKIYEDGC